MKTVAGSIMSGFSLLSIVIHEWSLHFFHAFYTMGKGLMLEGAGSFVEAPMYADGIATISLVPRILMWITFLFGIFLILSGTKEEEAKNAVKPAPSAKKTKRQK